MAEPISSFSAPAAPPQAESSEVATLLERIQRGDDTDAHRLWPLIYPELRRVARGLTRYERRQATLQATALVHEAYVRLVGSADLQDIEVEWQGRAHFLGVAARVMRRILVDHARSRAAAKRGGGSPVLPLDEESIAGPSSEVGAVDEALERLALFAPQDARVVELRFFGGLTLEETAEFLGVSRRTVVRVWRRARAWLHGELQGVASHGA